MSEKVTKAIHYAILTIIAIIFVLPLVWLILAAFDLKRKPGVKMAVTVDHQQLRFCTDKQR